MIYTIGDSHAWHCWLKVAGVETRQIGPMTMYRFGQSHPIVVRDIPQDSMCIFCWGEIDCRCHVHKYQPYTECIDGLVKNYIEVIKENQALVPNIWIFNVVPPPRRKDAISENPAFPFLGTDEERLSYVRYMNQRLKEAWPKFIDVYEHYCDKDGFLDMPKSDYHVHIADERPLINWLIKNQEKT